MRNPRSALVAALLLALAVGCGGRATVAPQTGAGPAPSSAPAAASASAAGPQDVDRTVTLRTADGERSAIVHHPASAKAGAPLIVALHPAASSASTMQSNFGWDGVADRAGAVVIYPEGLLDSYQDTWNGGLCCPPASQLKTDDVGFLTDLVTALQRVDSVGPAVYAVGFSNGAILAYDWACTRPHALAGLGVVAGALMVDCPHPTAVTVVAVHGTADPSIPIGGGPGPDGSRFPALTASLAPFRAADGCATGPVTEKAAAAGVSSWTCAGGRRVVVDEVSGLGHQWPGAGAAAGTTDGPLDATGFLWARLRSG